ncbi:MAG: hypothetical protein GXP31_07260 [Kiritimatiellaeota bacterium]|nr:hypothetical protein [Kiritimatiellota bacterium]
MTEYAKRLALLLAGTAFAAVAPATEPTHFTGIHKSSEMIFVYGVEVAFNADDPLPGDEIGVFTQTGLLCGATRIPGPTGFPAISVYKDDPLTPRTDGAHSGDALVFRFWRAADGKEYGPGDLELTYIEKTNAAGLPYWTSGNDVYRVDLRVGSTQNDSIRLTLSPGWNLVSMPFATMAQGPAKSILKREDGAAAISGSAWLWDVAAQQYVRQTAGFPAKRGFWVYCAENVTVVTTRIIGPTSTPDVTLAPQWNLVGPNRTAPRSQLPGLNGAVGVAWRWDAHSQQYKTVPPEAPLERGSAYWLLVSPQSPAVAGRGAPGSAGECNLPHR